MKDFLKVDKIDTRKLWLAKVKYFNAELLAGEKLPLGVSQPYVFLYEIDGKYINLFNPLEEVFTCQYNNSQFLDEAGNDSGFWVMPVSGEPVNGPYYVMDSRSSRTYIFDEDEIDMDYLKYHILNSDNFFIDRLDIINSLPLLERVKSKFILTMIDDFNKRRRFDSYLKSKEKGVQYKRV